MQVLFRVLVEFMFMWPFHVHLTEYRSIQTHGCLSESVMFTSYFHYQKTGFFQVSLQFTVQLHLKRPEPSLKRLGIGKLIVIFLLFLSLYMGKQLTVVYTRYLIPSICNKPVLSSLGMNVIHFIIHLSIS